MTHRGAIFGRLQVGMGRCWKILLVIGVPLAGAALGLLGALALGGFFRFGDLRHEFPPCFEVGAPFHHRFRPNCEGPLNTPLGPVSFRINEDGIRDLPRREILGWKSRVLVIGDSFVEGWWAEEKNTIGAELHHHFPDTYFINGGLRSTGPTLQAKRLLELLRIYRPAGVIWFANDTDGLDEKLACAIARDPTRPLTTREFETPELSLYPWQDRLVQLLGDGPIGRRTRLYFFEKHWLEIVQGPGGARCPLCKGVGELRKTVADAGIPLLPFYLVADEPLSGHYGGGGAYRNDLVACALAAGTPFHLVTLGASAPDKLARYYWKGDFHLNPEGVRLVVDRIAPAVGGWLSASDGKRP